MSSRVRILISCCASQGVPVADYVTAHEPPLAPEVVEPDRSLAGVYEAAYAAHAAAGSKLFASGK